MGSKENRFRWTPEIWKQWTEGEDATAKLQLTEIMSQTVVRAGHLGSRLVLDAGCGYGRLAETLLRTQPRSQVVAIDASPEMIKWTSRVRENGRLMPVLGSIARLPFKDAVFEIVFCVGVIMHVSHDALALSELMRVTAPSGKILLTFNNILNPMWLPFELYAKAAKGSGYVQRFRSLSFIRSACRRAGFTVRVVHPGFVIPGGRSPRSVSALISKANRTAERVTRSFGYEPVLEITH